MADVYMKFYKRRGLSVPEMELNLQTKHCLAKLEEQVMVSKSVAMGRVCHGRCMYEVS